MVNVFRMYVNIPVVVGGVCTKVKHICVAMAWPLKKGKISPVVALDLITQAQKFVVAGWRGIKTLTQIICVVERCLMIKRIRFVVI